MEHTDTLSQVALILAMAFAGETLLRRLRQPALLGYIIAGVLLGPHVLGVIHNQEQISLLAEMGILLLLFIIGLELDLKNFARDYRIATGTTLVQIGASLAVAALLGALLGWPPVRIILIGFAMSLSSTAVAIKLLEDMGGISAPLGRKAIGILVAQDLAIIPMMLIVGSFAHGVFNPWDLLKIGLALGIMGAVIYFLGRGVKPAVALPAWIKYQISGGDGQTVIKALAYCFSGAALSGALGLSASYGAFLAGLLIGSTQDHEHLEKQARPIFDILMMVFFLSVGLLIDLDFLLENIYSLFFLLLAIMALKTIVTIWTLRRMGVGRRKALIMGSVLGQIGEFSFVLAALGLSMGAIQDEGYKYVVSLIALSLIVTPAWLYFMRRLPLLRRRLRRKMAAA